MRSRIEILKELCAKASVGLIVTGKNGTTEHHPDGTIKHRPMKDESGANKA